MRYFFTSDYHLGHANIMKYCGRTLFMNKDDLCIYNKLIKGRNQEEQKKFKLSGDSLKRMDESIIKRHNERIKPEDIIFFIGDFCFKRSSEAPTANSFNYYKQKLNGHFIFVRGNHDKNNSCKTAIESLVIKLGNYRINLVHDPAFADVNYDINLVGHVHNKWKFKRIRHGFSFTDAINVGVDVNKFHPVTINEILGEYLRWKKTEGLN